MITYSDNEQNLKKAKNFQPLSAHISPRLTPILRKKGGFDADLLQNWPEIVGKYLSKICLPVKMKISRASSQSGNGKMMGGKSATLFIACEGLACLKVQHQADEILRKINAFFGERHFPIEHIKIVQKSLYNPMESVVPLRALRPGEIKWLEEQTSLIEDSQLRNSLSRFGENILARLPLP